MLAAARAVPSSLRKARLSLLSFRLWASSPRTRAHVRLLGPCFKTGRTSTRNYSAADGCCEPARGHGTPTAECGTRRALRSAKVHYTPTCARPKRRSLVSGSTPSSDTVGRSTGTPAAWKGATRNAVPSQTFRWALGRRPTGRDVLLREKCGPPQPYVNGAGDRVRRHGLRRTGNEGHPTTTAGRPARRLEPPFSEFRVFSVYP